MSGAVDTRVSQVVAEALVAANGDSVRASQIAVEALISTLGFVRASQAVAESLIATLGFVRVSQIVPEALIGTLGFVRVSQCVAEVLISTAEVPLPPIYPTLIGRGYSTVKRPIWNTVRAQAASGRQARAGLQTYPIWEFDLTYDLLSDGAYGINSTYESDLKTLMGFFNSVNGGVFPFLFTDEDDCSVTGQAIGTGDGTTTNFTLVRTFGGSDGNLTEPIGYLNQTVAPNVYVNNVLQETDAYTFITTYNYAQVLKLNTAPPAGQPVTMDFSYYFVVCFKDDQYDFEKIYSQIWDLKKLTLQTARN